MKLQKKQNKSGSFTMRLEQKTLASLEKIAKENDISVAEVVRIFIEAKLNSKKV